MMNRLVYILAIMLVGISMTTSVQASDLLRSIVEQTDAGAVSGGFKVNPAIDPRDTVAMIIRLMLGFVGITLVILIVMSGYWLITAKGDESKVEKAQKTLRSAIIGFVVVSLSYAVTIAVTTIAKDAQSKKFLNKDLQERYERLR
jgi:cytochrome bd-type quinol oxidase subunit 2